MAGRQVGRSRVANAAVSAGRTTAKRLGHIGHLLFLEVTGFLFMAIAIVCGSAAFRDYQRFTLGQTSAGRYKLASVFALLFCWFGVSSFLRVKKKTRRGQAGGRG
jgi:hypothetical protein